MLGELQLESALTPDGTQVLSLKAHRTDNFIVKAVVHSSCARHTSQLEIGSELVLVLIQLFMAVSTCT